MISLFSSIQERLKDLRTEQGLTLEKLAMKTGLSKSALGQYELNEGKDIGHIAILTLAKFYGVSTDYLLGMSENRNHPNTKLQALHLSDDMIDVLCSGKLNNRLLSELVTHPGFRQLLLDMEICVDRIADMHIRNLNQGLENARMQVLRQFAPEETDLYLRTLTVAQVEEDSYFNRLLYEDLTGIVRDIRRNHKTDTTTADEPPEQSDVEAQVILMLEHTAEFQGTPDQKRALLCCQMMKVDYFALPDSERTAMERICRQSPIFDTAINQRGRAKHTQKKTKKKRP